MNGATIHEGVRRMRFSSLLDRQERGEITQDEAAALLGVHVRTFQRWADRYSAEGESGLSDRRIGTVSPKRASAAEIARMLGLYRDKYSDFTATTSPTRTARPSKVRGSASPRWLAR